MAEITEDRPAGTALSSSKSLWIGIGFAFAYAVLIGLLRPYMPQIDFLPDTGFAWYVWKLPDPTFWTRFSAWGGYILHVGTIWALIYYAQSRNLRYTSGLHPVNVFALGATAFFVLLHLLQTAVFYDALAQDVPIWSSQGAVILLLVIVLIMENQRRGLVFGQKINLFSEPGRVLRKYHGYIFAWAAIYTFWYHPMEDTWGHLFGTFYTVLIMLQGALFFTRAHINRWWTVTLELFVAIHGTVVAVMIATSNDGAWEMFLFGFLAIFLITQMHGLGLSRAVRWAFVAAYAIGVVAVFAPQDWAAIERVPMIAFIEYSLAFGIALLIWIPLAFMDRRRIASASS